MGNLFKDYLTSEHLQNDSLDIQSYDIIKLTNRSRYTDEIVEKAMKNEIIPFPNFTSFKLNSLEDWSYSDSKYGDSYQLYIHSLRFVNELLIVYEENKESMYIDKARDYIYDWIEYAANHTGSKMVWYDHPTAQRSQVIIYYLYLSKDIHEIDNQLFTNVLAFHTKYLSNSSNYRRNNHGLMMDRSLMIIGNILNDNSIFNIGYYRSIDTFWYSYSYTGLHLENSPEYHNMVTNMYLELQKYLTQHGKSYGKTIVSYLNRASILRNIFTKPNKVIPSIGDSGNGVVKINKNYSNFIDYASGMSIIQDKKSEFFLTFVSGYSTITHKHFDDLSINLFFKGADFLVDPGKYSYSKHPYRSYVKSFKGHSGLFINNKNYTISDDNRLNKKVGIDHHFENENYVLVKGKNNSYSEGTLARTVIYIKKEQMIILLDDVYALETLDILHNFNFHHQVNVEKITPYSYSLSNKGIVLNLSNQTENIKFTKVLGDKNQEPYIALNSVVFNEVTETIQLKSEATINENRNSKTIFTINEAYLDPQVKLDDDNSLLEVRLKDKKYIINI